MQMTVKLSRLCHFWQEAFPFAPRVNLNMSLVSSCFRHNPRDSLLSEQIFLSFFVSVVAFHNLLIEWTQFGLIESICCCISNSKNTWSNVFFWLSVAFADYLLKYN